MIEQLLQIKTSKAIKKLYGQDAVPGSIGIEKTKKEIEGDYTVVLFPVSKISRKSPEDTAREIGSLLAENVIQIKAFNVIKGFLNIILKDDFWTGFLNDTLAGKEFGFTDLMDGPPVILEYSSPNTNKPLHLGHIRNNLLGFSLSRIIRANGFNVIRMNLVNDRGIHICKSMLAYMKWGNNETPASTGMKSDHLIGKYYVLFDKKYKEEVKALMDQGQTEEIALHSAPLILEAQQILQKWEANDSDVRKLWQTMNDWAFEGFNETYRNLGVEFDVVQHESDTYLSGKGLVQAGVDAGTLNRRPDGSIWADLTGEGLDEKLLLRSDGTSVYMTQDLGTAQLRYLEFHPSKMIYVVGNEQNYHFDVLKRVLKKLGMEWAGNLFHLSYGMVELPEGKMKSREGTVVDADDLMTEMFTTAEETTRALGKVDAFPEEEAKELFRIIGLGALKYFILKVDPKKNMLFDPKESIDFNGNTGPFIQYTYARIRSLLRKSLTPNPLPQEGGGLQPASSIEHRVSSIEHRASSIEHRVSSIEHRASSIEHRVSSLLPAEREVLRILYQFPEIVKQAGVDYNPALVANYVYDLAKEYNAFYQEIPVLKEENSDLRQLRLDLSFITSEVIKKAMWLLGIDVPERM